ncbi:MAG: hypothetical protein V2A54_15260, partial [Bacteroidota bacterium]
EIIAKEEIQSASHILDDLRQYVIHSLQQKGVEGEQQDGMDIAFIALNTETSTLEFSGANNPLYIISSSKLQVTSEENNLQPATCNLQLLEVKADKMPIGIYQEMRKPPA